MRDPKRDTSGDSDVYRVKENPTSTVLASHALGALTVAEEAEVEAHLVICEECRARLREFRQATSELVGRPVDVDLTVLDRIWSQVKQRIRR
jgi:anti-sigma factor RsiW